MWRSRYGKRMSLRFFFITVGESLAPPWMAREASRAHAVLFVRAACATSAASDSKPGEARLNILFGLLNLCLTKSCPLLPSGDVRLGERRENRVWFFTGGFRFPGVLVRRESRRFLRIACVLSPFFLYPP